MTDNRIKQIADYNGFGTILNKLTEECGELITEIARYQADDEGQNLYEIYREGADVLNMIEQLRLSEQEFFDEAKEYKINRQMQRMAKKAPPRYEIGDIVNFATTGGDMYGMTKVYVPFKITEILKDKMGNLYVIKAGRTELTVTEQRLMEKIEEKGDK